MQRTTDRSEARGVAARTAPGPIILAADGSPAAAAPFAVARWLAERDGARVEVVSVLEPLNVVVPPIDPPRPAMHHGVSPLSERHERIQALMRRTLGDARPWPTEIVFGERVPSLARVATERQARLVVTGHTHHGAVERIMRGETPLGIARAARVPVLAVPATMDRLPRCVVVGVGLGDAGTSVGDISHALFGDAVAIHLVHVRTAALPRHEREIREEDHAEEARGEHAFARVLASWRLPPDVPVATHERIGRPEDELLAVARALEADLLVVGLSPRPHAPHLPHRSLAPRLYREWPHALLIVPVDDAWARRAPDGGRALITRA
jgi:nucleotide-binding universal stress UspA family protein